MKSNSFAWAGTVTTIAACPRRHRCRWCLIARVGHGGTPPSITTSAGGGCPGAGGPPRCSAAAKHIPREWPPLLTTGERTRTDSDTASARPTPPVPNGDAASTAAHRKGFPQRTEQRYTRSLVTAASAAEQTCRADSLKLATHLLSNATGTLAEATDDPCFVSRAPRGDEEFP
jgi:hypothetical protein